jgi:uncharacterized membrane protein YqaE (UPF0057 family)
MTYLIAIVFPPAAMALAGKPVQALLCVLLMITIIGWIPAAIWALFVVSSTHADRRTNRIVRAMREREVER